MQPQSVSDIIDLWPSAEAFAADLGLKWPGHGRVMKLRGRIPGTHWDRLLTCAKQRRLPITRETLERIHRKDPVELAS